MNVIEYRICSSALGTENLNNNVFITQLLRFFIFTETVLNPFSLFYIDIKIYCCPIKNIIIENRPVAV